MRRPRFASGSPYRVLCRQFLLRVVDLESLSIQADIPRFLGQFAGVLLMLSFLHSMFAYIETAASPWTVEQYLLRCSMFVSGLITVMCWEATFPDRRDVMVLSVLPVNVPTILLAKVSSTGALLGLGLVALNAVPSLVVALLLGEMHRSAGAALQAFAAYWAATLVASLFLYGSVLALQGFLSVLLSRRVFLSISAVLQLVVFTFLLGVFFLAPGLAGPEPLLGLSKHAALGWLPPFWFSAVMNQMSGTMPKELAWLARRGWIGFGFAVGGAGVAMLASYLHTMKRTLEQQDLIPRARSMRWSRCLPGSGSVQATLLTFSVRSLLRSRHHRVAYAFYLSIVLAMGFSCAHEALATAMPHAMPESFLTLSLLMLSIAVCGLRSVMSLPITLNANWMLRLTELSSPERYLGATRLVLLWLAAVPVWLICAALAGLFRPFVLSAEHLVILALAGAILVELNTLNVAKIPFACSYLPGKSDVQVRFWAAVLVLLPIVSVFALEEHRMLTRAHAYPWIFTSLGALALSLWVWNKRMARSTVLHFEDVEPEVLTTLRLGGMLGAPLVEVGRGN